MLRAWAIIATLMLATSLGVNAWIIFGDHGHRIFKVEAGAHDAIVETLQMMGLRKVGTIPNPRRTVFTDGTIVASGEEITAAAISFVVKRPLRSAIQARLHLQSRGLSVSELTYPDKFLGEKLVAIRVAGIELAFRLARNKLPKPDWER